MAKITDYTKKLRSQVERMNAHPYKETTEDETSVRFFKEPLCAWDELEDFDIDDKDAFYILNHNKKIKKVLDACNLNVCLYADSGGYIYLMWC